MKIKYTGKQKAGFNLTPNSEYICCEMNTSVDNNGILITYLVFDDEGFLMPVNNSDCEIVDGRVSEYWEVLAPIFVPIEPPYKGFLIEYRDKRLNGLGEWDEVIDLPAYTACEEEGEETLVDVVGIKNRLDAFRQQLEKEGAELPPLED